jgi:hypothetical protein
MGLRASVGWEFRFQIFLSILPHLYKFTGAAQLSFRLPGPIKVDVDIFGSISTNHTTNSAHTKSKMLLLI